MLTQSCEKHPKVRNQKVLNTCTVQAKVYHIRRNAHSVTYMYQRMLTQSRGKHPKVRNQKVFQTQVAYIYQGMLFQSCACTKGCSLSHVRYIQKWETIVIGYYKPKSHACTYQRFPTQSREKDPMVSLNPKRDCCIFMTVICSLHVGSHYQSPLAWTGL